MKFKKIIIPVFAVLLVISIFAFSFFDSMMSDADGSTFAMGSPVTVKIYGERNGDEMIEPALETVKLLEKTYLSHSLSGSAISILNKENEIVSSDWFTDYIKNVASSEIYATWSDATITANILAIMSFTLNRVYTEWYRVHH